MYPSLHEKKMNLNVWRRMLSSFPRTMMCIFQHTSRKKATSLLPQFPSPGSKFVTIKVNALSKQQPYVFENNNKMQESSCMLIQDTFAYGTHVIKTLCVCVCVWTRFQQKRWRKHAEAWGQCEAWDSVSCALYLFVSSHSIQPWYCFEKNYTCRILAHS
jgi:hypothetical protein